MAGERDQGTSPGARRLERVLLRLAMLVLGVLVAMQAMGGPRVTETFLSYAERFEGSPDGALASGPEAAVPAGGLWLVLLLVSSPGEASARLLVNGRTAAEFSEPEATVIVADGDELALEAPGQDELRLRVVAESPELSWPRLGQEFSGRGALALGTVRGGRP